MKCCNNCGFYRNNRCINTNHINAIIEKPKDKGLYNCFDEFIMNKIANNKSTIDVKNKIKKLINLENIVEITTDINTLIDYVVDNVVLDFMKKAENTTEPETGIVIDNPSEFCCNQHWD